VLAALRLQRLPCLAWAELDNECHRFPPNRWPLCGPLVP
jgi:hypothetical protein